MNFGMTSYEGLTEDDFIFPDVEQPYLPGNKNGSPKICIGLSGWGYKEELRKPNTPFAQHGTLPFYSKHFTTTELINTFDNFPTTEQVSKWYNATDIGFKFCPQINKMISHIGDVGIHKVGATNDFIKMIRGLKEKLGPVLIQLNDTASIETKDNIFAYLQKLPTDIAAAIELRNEDWFVSKTKFEVFVRQVNAVNKSIVITDTPGRRDAVHMHLSNNIAFIRFVCDGNEVLDMFRIEQWRRQLRSWYLQGLDTCYFFLHINNKNAENDFIEYVKSELIF
jgi:uncharacterized protein YecE (DUF72 family)